MRAMTADESGSVTADLVARKLKSQKQAFVAVAVPVTECEARPSMDAADRGP